MFVVNLKTNKAPAMSREIKPEDYFMKVNKGKVELVNFARSEESCEFRYSVEQNNGSTSVEQALRIVSSDGLFAPTWIADLTFSDFPPQQTPGAAAIKLADWMDRLASAIRSGEYLELPPSEFKDLTPEVRENE